MIDGKFDDIPEFQSSRKHIATRSGLAWRFMRFLSHGIRAFWIVLHFETSRLSRKRHVNYYILLFVCYLFFSFFLYYFIQKYFHLDRNSSHILLVESIEIERLLTKRILDALQNWNERHHLLNDSHTNVFICLRINLFIGDTIHRIKNISSKMATRVSINLMVTSFLKCRFIEINSLLYCNTYLWINLIYIYI